MTKHNLPLNKYFFAKNNALIYKFKKKLFEYYQKDKFGYFIIVSQINKKKLKFIKKTFNSFSFLNPQKNYAIFINFSKSYKFNKKVNAIFLENFIDNAIYIYEII